jgi:hypothetical protein
MRSREAAKRARAEAEGEAPLKQVRESELALSERESSFGSALTSLHAGCGARGESAATGITGWEVGARGDSLPSHRHGLVRTPRRPMS